MAKDQFGDRYAKQQGKKKLGDLANRGKSADELDEEQEYLDSVEKVEPIKADATPGRNDPCPCGSGQKYKKCCALK